VLTSKPGLKTAESPQFVDGCGPVFSTWQAYQTIISAYRDPDACRGKQALTG